MRAKRDLQCQTESVSTSSCGTSILKQTSQLKAKSLFLSIPTDDSIYYLFCELTFCNINKKQKKKRSELITHSPTL